MKKYVLLFLTVFCLVHMSYAQEMISIGTKHRIFSSGLNEEREYWVYLPPSYDAAETPDKNYPVIYLIDGEMYFHALTAIHCTYSRGRMPMMPECIVIGVVNTDRTRDLTPTRSAYDRNGQLREDGQTSGGGGEQFLAYLTDELRPAIDETFRSNGENFLLGHSYGGLFTLHTMTYHTDAFDKYIALDPSLWWDNAALAQVCSDRYAEMDFTGKELYIGVATKPRPGRETIHRGTLGGYVGKTIPQAIQNGLVFHYKEFPEDTHGTLPMPGFMDAFKAVFDENQ